MTVSQRDANNIEVREVYYFAIHRYNDIKSLNCDGGNISNLIDRLFDNIIDTIFHEFRHFLQYNKREEIELLKIDLLESYDIAETISILKTQLLNDYSKLDKALYDDEEDAIVFATKTLRELKNAEQGLEFKDLYSEYYVKTFQLRLDHMSTMGSKWVDLINSGLNETWFDKIYDIVEREALDEVKKIDYHYILSNPMKLDKRGDK